MSYPPHDYNNGENDSNKFAVATLSARIAAMLSFIVAIAVLQTNDVKIDSYSDENYKNFRSYEYAFWVALIGLGYTVLQLPFAMHYMLRKKHLIGSYGFLKFDFYADKVAAFVVATAAGAAFGTTMDMKHQVTWFEGNDKMQNFLTVSYIAATFLLVGGMACWISAVHSSLALTHKSIQQF